MKSIFLLLAALAILPAIASADVVITPSTTAPNANVSTNFTISMDITNHDSYTYTNVRFNSTYLVGFSPVGAVLVNGSTVPFTLTMDIPEFYGNVNSTIVNDTLRIDATNGSTDIGLGAFVISINLSLQNSNMTQRDYYFKKCFLENNQEFCSPFNISDVQNVTILNQTVEYQNVTWDLLVPYNITQEFMRGYNESLDRSARAMEAAQAAIQNASVTIIYVQNRTDNMYKNAIMLEGFLKNENTELWTQTFPTNMLINATGLDQAGFDDAMSYLYQTGKIQQTIEQKDVTLTMADGSVSTKKLNFISVASKERINTEENLTWSYNVATVGILIAVVSVGMILFYAMFWTKRVKGLKA